MNSDFHDITINLAATILGALLLKIYHFFYNSVKSHEFKRMFGDEALENFYLVYGKMVVKELYNSNGQIEQWPFSKPGSNKQFRCNSPISFTETKSAKYLAEAFSQRSKTHPVLISDDEINDELNISYCSLGGFNNAKTVDILDSEQNNYYEIDLSNAAIKSKRENKSFYIDNNFDYGIILKIRNKHFPDKTQICIAGLGDFGTSGAAWFLANKWKEILKHVGVNNFGCVIKVKIGKDQSAVLVDILPKLFR